MNNNNNINVDLSTKVNPNLGNGTNRGTPSSILNARSNMKVNAQDSIQSLLDAKDILEAYTNDINKFMEKLSKSSAEIQKALSKDTNIKAYKANLEQLDNIMARINKMQDNQNISYQDLLDLVKDTRDVTADVQTNQELINATLNKTSLTYKKLNTSQRQSIANIKEEGRLRRKNNKESREASEREYKEASKALKDARKQAFDKFTSSLSDLKKNLNLDSITASITEGAGATSKAQLQTSLQRAYGLSNSGFTQFKKDINNQVNTRLYNPDDISNIMSQLQDLGLGNTESATKHFNTLIQGQKLLGMTAETQASLLKLSNKTGRDELQFATNRVAQYMKTATNIGQKQLNELVALNTQTLSDLNTLGVNSEENQATLYNATTALDNMNAGDSTYSDIYRKTMVGLLQNETESASRVGMGSEQIREFFQKGGGLEDLLNSGGTWGTLWQDIQQGRGKTTRMSEQRYVDSGFATQEQINLFKEMYRIQEQTGMSFKDYAKSMQVDETDDSAVKEREKEALKTLSTTQQAANEIANYISTKIDWVQNSKLQGTLSQIVSILLAMSVLNNASSMFGGSGLSKGTSWFGGTGKGTGLGTKLFGAGSKLGGTAGVSKWSWGNGALSGLAKVGGTLGAIQTGMDAIGGATTLSNELYGDNASFGQRAGGALMGMFSGTKVYRNEDGTVNGTKNTLMGGLSGAAKGAAIGGFFGPLGMAIGAGIGGIGGLIAGAVKNKEAKKQQEELESQTKLQGEIAKNTSTTSQQLGVLQQSFAPRSIQSYVDRGSGGPLGGDSPVVSSSAIQKRQSTGIGGDEFSGKSGQKYGPWFVTSPYGVKRTYTNTQGKTITDVHSGIDLARSGLQKIYATEGGVVSKGYYPSGGGNQISVTGDDGKRYVYCHLKETGLKTGDIIKAGDGIGIMGATGNVTGQHLHYGVYSGGSHINPVPYLNSLIYGGNGSDRGLYASSSATDSGTSLNRDGNKTSDNKTLYTSTTKVNSISQTGVGYGSPEPIVNSIMDLKNTIIELSDRTSQNEKILGMLAGKKLPNPTM